jgi:DNA primase
MDPADMVKNGHIEQLNALFRHPIAFIEFVLTEMINTYNLNDPKAKEGALHETIAYLKTLSPLMQEEYRGFIASKLGISPSLVKISHSPATKHEPINFSHHDIWELSLVKTILERPTIIDSLLDFIEPQLLQYHGSELFCAINGEDDPRLRAIVMDDRIRIFEGDDAIRLELITFLTHHYNRELKKIASENTISFDEKSYKIRQMRDKIGKLKRGELVPLGDSRV